MIALDSSAVMCLVEHHQPAARAISAHVLGDEDRILLSVVALTECFVGPLKTGDRDLYWRYRAFFDQPEIQMREVTAAIAERAASLRADFGLKAIDSLHLATALESRAGTFVSTDQKDFSRCVGRVNLDIMIVPRGPDRS